jgi:hypothetical protein
MKQLVDVLWFKVAYQHVLLGFSEIEQLIDEFQKPMGIAVDDL